jgi:hypothetical protein
MVVPKTSDLLNKTNAPHFYPQFPPAFAHERGEASFSCLEAGNLCREFEAESLDFQRI